MGTAGVIGAVVDMGAREYVELFSGAEALLGVLPVVAHRGKIG